jgi:DnaD/phage-associated family protein
MKGFPGFPDGKLKTLPLPEQVFTELLPIIDHLGELKVTLYAFWRLSVKEGQYRFLRRDDFANDELFMRGLAASPRQAEEILDDALERAEARGTLLHIYIEDAQTTHNLYFVNSPKGREAVEKLTQGEWRPAEQGEGVAITLSRMRSNIYTLYEQNIGALTPMIVEELRDMADTYPAAWIEDAIRVAVKNNARKLKYILAVLERMRAEGRYDQTTTDTEDDLSRYDGYLPYADTESDDGNPAPDS